MTQEGVGAPGIHHLGTFRDFERRGFGDKAYRMFWGAGGVVNPPTAMGEGKWGPRCIFHQVDRPRGCEMVAVLSVGSNLFLGGG